MAAKRTYLEVLPNKAGEYYLREKAANGEVTVVGESGTRPSKARVRAERMVARLRGEVCIRILNRDGEVVSSQTISAVDGYRKIEKFKAPAKKVATKKNAAKRKR